MGKDIRLFPLPDIDHSYDDASHIPREIFEDASIEHNLEDVLLCDSLNAEQRSAYDEIIWPLSIANKVGNSLWMDLAGWERPFCIGHFSQNYVARTSLSCL